MTTDGATIQSWLESFIAAQGGVAGTVHRVIDDGAALASVATVNIPPQVQAVTAVVPRGKGMAGLALEREEPVSTCNLADDRSGDVRPGAKAVAAQAAVALPLRDGAKIWAVVGIAFAQERDWSREELDALAHAAASLTDACRDAD